MTCNGPTSEDPAQELARLDSREETFASFPSLCPVSSSTLAQAGFFYTGERDKVKCFSCHAALEGWERGDSVVGRHRAVSPNCRFLEGANFGWRNGHSRLPNGPAGSENRLTATSLPSGLDPPSDLDADYLLRTRQVVDLSSSSCPQNPAMCSEAVRLRSFCSWPPHAPVAPEELASAGLYYRGVDDEVECFCCGGRLKNWEPSDQAWSEHRRHFPKCFFVLGHNVGNVRHVPNQDGDVPLGRRDLHPIDLPHNPSMADLANRIKTFVSWNYLVSKESLAQAGFYSLGAGDSVACFSCGGGLQEWKAGEDPWEQHARWYPGCKYLTEEKGQAFVNNVHLNNSLQDPTTEEAEKVLSVEDEERLQNQMIQDALHMGFSQDEIRKTIERKRQLSAERYRSVEALITDLVGNQRENTSSGFLESSLPKDLSTEEKLRRLEEEKICKICMDKPLSVVLIPCGHLACQDCADAVEKCPWCCKIIANRQKIFIP